MYQDIPYSEELVIKEEKIKDLFKDTINNNSSDIFEPIVPSPKHYHYRNRLDLKLKRIQKQNLLIGFSPKGRKHGVVPIDNCFIAQGEIARFIPELKQQAQVKLSDRYQMANLVVRTGDDGRVFWGGIGRRSCQLEEKD